MTKKDSDKQKMKEYYSHFDEGGLVDQLEDSTDNHIESEDYVLMKREGGYLKIVHCSEDFADNSDKNKNYVLMKCDHPYLEIASLRFKKTERNSGVQVIETPITPMQSSIIKSLYDEGRINSGAEFIRGALDWRIEHELKKRREEK